MIKPKLLAATLAAASVFTLCAPAFAEEADPSIDSNIESQMENTDSEPSAEDVTECDSTETDTADTEIDDDLDDDDFGNIQTLAELNNNAVSTMQLSTSSTKVYTNERGQTVYEADNAVAYVNKDGISGRLYINTNKYNKVRVAEYTGSLEETYSISTVGDINLSDIIKFKDNGYVSYIEGQIGTGYGVSSCMYDSGIKVRAAGPSGLTTIWTGSLGHLTFTDKAGVSDSLSIFDSSEKEHTLNNNSDDPYVTMVEWYSDGNNEYLNAVYPDNPFDNLPVSTDNTKVYVNEEGQTVYEAEDMTAYVNKDGISGKLVINTDKFNYRQEVTATYPRYHAKWKLNSVGDVPLKDIMKFNDGGHVISMSADVMLPEKVTIMNVVGIGPRGTFNGNGNMTFYDENGETGSTSFWSHTCFNTSGNEVHLTSNSDKVTVIEWYS